MKSPQRIAAVILAAGESKRMGRPKMLLDWGGSTVIGSVVRVFAAAGIADILVVTGGARELVEAEVLRLSAKYPVRTVFNPAHAEGEMVSSLQCGLQQLARDCPAALVGLGDQPQVQESTIRAVIDAYQDGDSQIIIPSFQKRRGHPWLIASALWPGLAELKPPATPRDFLNTHAGLIEYVSVETPTVLQDVDTPEDIKRFGGA